MPSVDAQLLILGKPPYGYFPITDETWGYNSNIYGPAYPVETTVDQAVTWHFLVNQWRHTLEFNLIIPAMYVDENQWDPAGNWCFRIKTVGPGIILQPTLTERILPDPPGGHVEDESDLVYPAQTSSNGSVELAGELVYANGDVIPLDPDVPEDPPLGSTPGGTLSLLVWGENPMVFVHEDIAPNVRPAFLLQCEIGSGAARDDSPLGGGATVCATISTSQPTAEYKAAYAISNPGYTIQDTMWPDAWTIDGITADVYAWWAQEDYDDDESGINKTIPHIPGGTLTLTSEIISYNAWGGARDTVTGALL